MVPIVPLVSLMTSDDEQGARAEVGEQEREDNEKSGKEEQTVEEYVQNMLRNAVSSGKEIPIILLTTQPEKTLPSLPKNPILEKRSILEANKER